MNKKKDAYKKNIFYPPKKLFLTRYIEDLVEWDAVIESSRDDALCPQALGLQLIHLPAGVHVVLTGHHPVVRWGRYYNTSPADAAH